MGGGRFRNIIFQIILFKIEPNLLHLFYLLTSRSTHELNFLLQKLLVSMIMIKTITIPTNTTIEKAALIMQQTRISTLPGRGGRGAGRDRYSTDVMAVLLQAIGISEESVRLSIFVRDSIGKLAAVADTLKDQVINIQSFFCWPDNRFPGISEVVLRVV